jgi:hypothetical protein
MWRIPKPSARRKYANLAQANITWAMSIAGLIVLAALLPSHAQDQAYHAFADNRAWGLIPNAVDTLTNGAFVLAGLIGLFWFKKDRLELPSMIMRVAVLTFVMSTIAIGLSSAYYHWQPTDERLVVDRLAMSVAFASVLTMLAQERLEARSATITYMLMMILGPSSVMIWAVFDNLTPYYLLQFGGVLLAIILLTIRPPMANGPNFWALLMCYFLAKLAEMFDAGIFAMTHEIISGHALKHLLSAIGMVLLLASLRPDAKADLDGRELT